MICPLTGCEVVAENPNLGAARPAHLPVCSVTLVCWPKGTFAVHV